MRRLSEWVDVWVKAKYNIDKNPQIIDQKEDRRENK
jgi:hypothetical protein